VSDRGAGKVLGVLSWIWLGWAYRQQIRYRTLRLLIGKRQVIANVSLHLAGPIELQSGGLVLGTSWRTAGTEGGEVVEFC
jgi:hypothetical protein